MADEKRNLPQIIWGVILIAMGLLLCLKEPYALRAYGDSVFLNFARYFIAALLITAGAKKLHRFYFKKERRPPS